MSIYDECLAVYEREGQSAVFDYVLANYPECAWLPCDPCEVVSPVEGNTCLVCGSEVNA